MNSKLELHPHGCVDKVVDDVKTSRHLHQCRYDCHYQVMLLSEYPNLCICGNDLDRSVFSLVSQNSSYCLYLLLTTGICFSVVIQLLHSNAMSWKSFVQ